jgi:DNA helicase-2/ATP-dependent DNA helicase PcrA
LDAAYEAYDNVLRRYGALDFDDLLFHAHRLLTSEEQIRDLYRTIYRYVMIDEAQDTSLAQYEIIRSIFSDPSHGNVMLVADADQSIFQFSGADVEHLLRFEREFKAQRWGLTRNFRCSGTIVAAANELIRNNPDRLTSGAEMTSAVLASGLIIASSYADAEEEAKAAVNYVEEILREGLPRNALYADEDAVVTPEQVCILARARYLLDHVRLELEQRSIEYHFSTGRDAAIFESKEFAAISAAMRWRINANDGIARRSLARALQMRPEAWNDAKTLGDVLDALPHDLQNVLVPLRVSTNRAAVAAFVDAVDAYVLSIEDEDAQAAATSDLALLRERWIRLQADVGEDALARVESEIALLGSAKVHGPGVRVLTIHAAKGLEFRAVMLVGMNEGGFPHYRSMSDAAVVEERRSAYVAFTRAERVLALLRFRNQTTKYGTQKTQQESRFISEAGLTMERR